MKKLLFCFATILSLNVQAQNDYKIVKTYHIASAGGWDYLAVNQQNLYVSHGTQVNILNKQTGDSVGVIPNTSGVHGIAFNNALGRGYTSNGRTNNVSVFDLKTSTLITQVTTGENPDAILYEPFSKTIITCNGRGKNLSVIDPSNNAVIATIDMGGKPETAVSDGKGKLFVNVEDKNEIVVVDTKSHVVLHHWTLTPGEEPTGLAYDPLTHRLFAGCSKLLVVLDAEKGTIVSKIVIGDGCDGVAFDSRNKLIFTSNGEGTMSVIKETSADHYELLGNYATKRGARTITIDEAGGDLFLPTADFEAPVAQGTRPKMIPGSFQVLVIKTTK
jgi:YVTN family beta-propeller protein